MLVQFLPQEMFDTKISVVSKLLTSKTSCGQTGTNITNNFGRTKPHLAMNQTADTVRHFASIVYHLCFVM